MTNRKWTTRDDNKGSLSDDGVTRLTDLTVLSIGSRYLLQWCLLAYPGNPILEPPLDVTVVEFSPDGKFIKLMGDTGMLQWRSTKPFWSVDVLATFPTALEQERGRCSDVTVGET
mgnify:CR=1 FL=1